MHLPGEQNLYYQEGHEVHAPGQAQRRDTHVLN